MTTRSSWKGPFISYDFLTEDFKKLNQKNFKTTSRSSVVLPFLLNKTVSIHNGKFLIPVFITEDMVGHKLGEFVLTRLRHVYIKKKMGQKANPNSFQNLFKTNNFLSSYSNFTEYSNFLQQKSFISLNLITLFEKNNCIVKDCFIVLNNEKKFLTIFITFFVLKRQRRTKLNVIRKTALALLIKKIFLILTNFGYISSKRLVLQNLNKIAIKFQKTNFFKEVLTIKKDLTLFQKEIYFNSGLLLFSLMNVTKNNSILMAKFIAKFFRIFYRSKKINKFLQFLSIFIENTSQKIKGLKVQIKGRFHSVPRTQTKLFEKGRIPLQTISAKINYALKHINTSFGVFGIKVWLFE